MKAETIETDVLIIGGGAAGCSSALQANRLGARVLMVVKGKMGRSGATPLASGIQAEPRIGIPVPVLAMLKKIYVLVSKFVHVPIPAAYEKILRGMWCADGALVDQDYFLNLALWGLKRFFPRLEHNGIYVRRTEGGDVLHPAAGGFTYIIHSHGMTGYQFGEARRKEVLSAGIPVMEEAMVFSFLKNAAGEVAGAMALDYKSGRLYAIKAGATILATGHTNWLSKRATGTREMAANGLAMAARAGAELQNLEIQWFHAADMASPDSWMRLHHYPNPFHGSTHRGVMKNSAGEIYMRVEEYDSRTPYTIQMKKLYEQINAGKARWDGGSYTNFSPVGESNLRDYQYHWEFYEKLGKNMAKDDMECGVTWHMTGGGVRADVHTMATGVPRLYVAGAVGAHILGGLPPATYDGEVAAANAVQCTRRMGPPASWNTKQITDAENRLAALLATADAKGSEPSLSPIQVKNRIRDIIWKNMMFVRNEQRLKRTLEELASVRSDLPKLRLRSASERYNTDLIDALDIVDMLDICEMTAQASLLRCESRGPHFREDFPYTDNENWLKLIVLRREDGEVRTRMEPVEQKYVRFKPERIDYFEDPYA
jgi:succinate dehydrogenase / fumarate reductase flavoprotein subunit